MDKVLERFWTKVSIAFGDCWEWLGYRQPNGYGRFWNGERAVPAHRYIYEVMIGTIPDGYEPDHLCRNRGCVNPYHLELVTRQENTKRGLLPEIMRKHQSSKTHCPQGHPYDEANTYYRKDKNGRECKTCRREAVRRYILKCRT